jgi:glycosyltransferase involved in cell wall biosynthesis
VDDGSTDETDDVVAAYHPHEIIFLKHPYNRGQNAALNAGVRRSRAEYCAFLDSDDEWHPSFLQRVMDKFAGNDNLGCVYTRAAYLDSPSGDVQLARPFTLEGHIYKEALAQGFVSHMITLVVKRSLLFEAGLFDEDFTVCQDDDMCFRLARIAEFGLITEPLATIHQDAGDQATVDRSKYAEGVWRLANKFCDEISVHCGDPVLSRHFERCGDLFWLSGNREMSLCAYRKAIQRNSHLLLIIKSWLLRYHFLFQIVKRLKSI